VARVIDPADLRYVVIPHFEADECGALNLFLDRAPHAVPVCSPVGVVTNLADFAAREPLPVDGASELDLGAHRLRFLITPYVHTWESMLPYDATTRTVFCSDVFIGPDGGQPIIDTDQSDAMLEVYRTVGIFPSKQHLDAALDKIEAVGPQTLACHRGSVKGGRLIRDATLVTMIPRKSGPDPVPRVVCLINFTVGDAARVAPDELAARTT
jgi:flavorubredoxin